MPFRKDLKPKKPRTTFKTVIRSLQYNGQGEYKDIVTKQEVQDFYPELKKMLANASEEFLYTRLSLTIEDPDKTPSNKFENETNLATIDIYGDSGISLPKKKFDENGNIVLIKNPKTGNPIFFSPFDPDGETYNKLINRLEKKMITEGKDNKWVEIELSGYKAENFNPEYPVWKSSYTDIKNLKILGTVPKRKMKIKDSWIKANPEDAKKLQQDRPEYFDKTVGFKDHKEFNKKEI